MSKTMEMTSYSDNQSADKMYKYLKNRRVKYPSNERIFYWPVGTHYFKPLPRNWNSRKDFLEHVQNPRENLYVVGEMVSRNQGWTEGALESVENILSKLVQKY